MRFINDRDPDGYNDDRSATAQEPAIEEPIDYSRPEFHWDLEIFPADPKRPDDAQEIADKEFKQRLEKGELYKRSQIVKQYDDGIKEIERQEGMSRQTSTLVSNKLRDKKIAEDKKREQEAARQGIGRRRGRGLSLAGPMVTEDDDDDDVWFRRCSAEHPLGCAALSLFQVPS